MTTKPKFTVKASLLLAYRVSLLTMVMLGFSFHARALFDFDALSKVHWAYLWQTKPTFGLWLFAGLWSILLSVIALLLIKPGLLQKPTLSLGRIVTLPFRKLWQGIKGMAYGIWLGFLAFLDRRKKALVAVLKKNTSSNAVLRKVATVAGSADMDDEPLFEPGKPVDMEDDLVGDWSSFGLAFAESDPEPRFYQTLRQSERQSAADLASAIHHWLAGRDGWVFRPDLIINADMGDKTFEGDGFGAIETALVTYFAMNAQEIRLFAFMGAEGREWSVPSYEQMTEGPQGSWTTVEGDKNGLELPCPVGALMRAQKRLLAGFEQAIKDAYPYGSMIFPTLVIGNGGVANPDALSRLQMEGLLDIIHFQTPGSVSDSLGGEMVPLSPEQLALFQALLQGEKVAERSAREDVAAGDKTASNRQEPETDDAEEPAEEHQGANQDEEESSGPAGSGLDYGVADDAGDDDNEEAFDPEADDDDETVWSEDEDD